MARTFFLDYVQMVAVRDLYTKDHTGLELRWAKKGQVILLPPDFAESPRNARSPAGELIMWFGCIDDEDGRKCQRYRGLVTADDVVSVEQAIADGLIDRGSVPTHLAPAPK